GRVGSLWLATTARGDSSAMRSSAWYQASRRAIGSLADVLVHEMFPLGVSRVMRCRTASLATTVA
ncbi:hypothetical protein AN933_07600, partial [Mycobacterium intracellulare subsp. chimaera]